MKIQTTRLPLRVQSKLSSSAWLTISYLALSIVWIMLGDSLAAEVSGNDKVLYEKIQSLKGIFFILVSAVFLYLFSRKLYLGIELSNMQTESIQKKYQALNEAAREGLFEYDYKENKASLNTKMKFFFPAEGNEITDFWQNCQRRVHPDDMERLSREYEEVIRTYKQIWKSEFRLMGVDGKYYRVISNAYLIRHSSSNEIIRIIGAIQDITDLRSLQTDYYEQKLKHRRTLAASIIQAQETERTRWAEELHDNVCQILSVANMYAIDVTDHPENLPSLGPQLKKLVAESINEIRQLSATIRTPAFDQETLVESIEKLSANINRLKPVTIELDNQSLNEGELENDKKLMIYRVVQEQINNIIKYAEARSVEIKLDNTSSNQVLISVKDDGKGFDPLKVKTGIGLRNIQSRLQVYNGNIAIHSSPGNGCLLEASFPN
ncbi:MAG TPA: PAS domain-containing protein [Chitinophagaceae bacterium]|nr:PAS domain-containing protein [Chitinophagaceae bacterium]